MPRLAPVTAITFVISAVPESRLALVHERVHPLARIVELEKELAARSEENRELLKLKIEMLRRQLEAEREHDQMAFN